MALSVDTHHGAKTWPTGRGPRLSGGGRRRYPRWRHGGFTIIELMVTLLVVSVLAGLAVPEFGRFLRESRMQTGRPPCRIVTGMGSHGTSSLSHGLPVT